MRNLDIYLYKPLNSEYTVFYSSELSETQNMLIPGNQAVQISSFVEKVD